MLSDKDVALQCLKKLPLFRCDDYGSWLTVGMALKSAGLPLATWKNWSKQSVKYQKGVCAQKWKSFKNGNSGVSVGTLVQWVKDAGENIDYRQKRTGYVLTWDSEIGPRSIPEAPKGNTWQAEHLVKYLESLFKDDETVNFVVKSTQANDRNIPYGYGENKNRDLLINELWENKHDITFAIGDYKEAAGAWIRINPMDGNGCKNSNCTEYRHVLVESDDLLLEKQLSIIRKLNLPTAAIVHSGRKSIHAITKIQAGHNAKLFRERVEFLFETLEKYGFKVDRQCSNPARLSRMPGITRAGKKQYLISVNEGAESWESWENEIRSELYEYDLITPEKMTSIKVSDKSDAILGNRFLCHAGSWLIVAQSGIGKSVLAMQGCCHFATGRALFGLQPIRPLKQILIQAENNLLDLVEPFQSLTEAMEFSKEERRLLNANFSIINEDSQAGEFFAPFLDHVCKRYAPDVIWLDPLMAYIGDDISKQAVCSVFLRNQVNPILHRYNVGLIVLHHTAKPPKNPEKQAQGHDLSYLGIGSSELTNWARAVSTVLQSPDSKDTYVFEHSKRGDRAGTSKQIFLKHAVKGIYWEKTGAPEKTIKSNNRNSKYADFGFDYMPPKTHTKDPVQSELFAHIIEIVYSKTGKNITPKQADYIKSAITKLKNPLIIYDKKTNTWRGRFFL